MTIRFPPTESRDARRVTVVIERPAIWCAPRADRRAQRDAKLARMRAALQPALLAAWGLQTVAVDVRHSPKSSTPEERRELLADAMKGLN